MEIRRERMLQKFKPQYEEVVDLNKQISATKAKIRSEIREIVNMEMASIRALKAEELRLKRSTAKLKILHRTNLNTHKSVVVLKIVGRFIRHS